MTREEIVFVDGLSIKKINDDFWALSFKVENFNDFMTTYKTESGYLNINICKSKKDETRYFAKLNTWTPQPKEEKTVKEVFDGEVLGDEVIPF